MRSLAQLLAKWLFRNIATLPFFSLRLCYLFHSFLLIAGDKVISGIFTLMAAINNSQNKQNCKGLR